MTNRKTEEQIGEVQVSPPPKLGAGEVQCGVCGHPGTIDFADALDKTKEGVRIKHAGRQVACRDTMKGKKFDG